MPQLQGSLGTGCWQGHGSGHPISCPCAQGDAFGMAKPFGRQGGACCSRECREGASTQGTDLPQKNNPLLGAAFTLLRLFKGLLTVLKSNNSESDVNCGHIHMAEELRGLGTGGRAGAASWDLT